MSNDSIIIHGHLLKEAREDLNLSLEDVARQLTLSSKHIISMEENKKDGFVSTPMKLISVRKYIAFLELDIDAVIEHKKIKQSLCCSLSQKLTKMLLTQNSPLTREYFYY